MVSTQLSVGMGVDLWTVRQLPFLGPYKRDQENFDPHSGHITHYLLRAGMRPQGG